MATEQKPKAPTPVEEIAELRTQLAKANTSLTEAQGLLATATENYAKVQGDVTGRTNELIDERRAHAESKLKLQKAEADLAAEKLAHDALKAKKSEEIQVEGAKIAAANGHPAAPAAAASKPGAVPDPVDKSKLSGEERLALSLKADIKG